MKAQRLAILLVVVLATSGVGPGTVGAAGDDAGAAGAQQTVTLTVTVTDNFNNAIGDVKLTATWDGGSSTATTASNGKAFLDVEKGADVEITVESSAYTRNSPYVVEDASEQDVDITVWRKATAEVKVVQNGAPVGDARVVLYKEGRDNVAARGRTDGDGVYTSPTIEKGTYTVVAFKPGFEKNRTTVEVSGTTSATVAIVEGTVTVDVKVVDDHFSPARAIEGATIEIEGLTSASLTTSGGGTGTIGLPVNAQYTITVSKSGYQTKRRTVSVGESPKTVEFTISRTPSLSVDPVNERVVVGEKVQLTVTDEYGETVANASIYVDGEKVGETDDQGVYRATIQSSGSHTITAKKDGVTSAKVTVEGVSSGDAGTATRSPTPGGTGDGTAPDLGLGEPRLVVQVGVAAAGVILAFLVVRRLL